MSLIAINIPESLGNSITDLLTRIAVALERIAGPEFVYTPGEPATLKDYSFVTPEDADRIRQAQEDFASGHMLVPGSPAYIAAIEEFERQVANSYGEDAVSRLPWKAPTSNPPIPAE